jgi:hypothetical protein
VARKTKVEKVERYRNLLRGLVKNEKPGDTVTLGGKKYAVAQLAATIQGLIDDHDRTSAAYADWLDAVARERASERDAHDLLAEIELRVQVFYDATSAAAADYGVKRRKPGRKSAAVKAAAVVKARATRAKRGTTGKKRRRSS